MLKQLITRNRNRKRKPPVENSSKPKSKNPKPPKKPKKTDAQTVHLNLKTQLNLLNKKVADKKTSQTDKNTAEKCWDLLLDYHNKNFFQDDITEVELDNLLEVVKYCSEFYNGNIDSLSTLNEFKAGIYDSHLLKTVLPGKKIEYAEKAFLSYSAVTPKIGGMKASKKIFHEYIISYMKQIAPNYKQKIEAIEKMPIKKQQAIRKKEIELYLLTLELFLKGLIEQTTAKIILVKIQETCFKHIATSESPIDEFNQLIKQIIDLQDTQASLDPIPDLYLALPTLPMLLHSSHCRYTKDPKASGYLNVMGDSALRIIHVLRGVVAFLKSNSTLKLHLIQIREEKEEKNEKSTLEEEDFSYLQRIASASDDLKMPLVTDPHGDVIVNKHTPKAIRDSFTLGKKAAEETLKTGRSSICFIRPPGHHAKAGKIEDLSKDMKKAEGFCFVNTVFVSAKHIAKEHNLKAILIIDIDIDIHDGNGTKVLLESWDNQNCEVFFLNTYNALIYPHDTQTIPSPQNTPSVTFYEHEFKKKIKKNISTDQEIISKLQENLISIQSNLSNKGKKIDSIFISYGLDGHQEDPLGNESRTISLSTHFYIELIQLVKKQMPNVPLNIFLEGGYNLKIIEEVTQNLLATFQSLNLKTQNSYQKTQSLLTSNENPDSTCYPDRSKSSDSMIMNPLDQKIKTSTPQDIETPNDPKDIETPPTEMKSLSTRDHVEALIISCNWESKKPASTSPTCEEEKVKKRPPTNYHWNTPISLSIVDVNEDENTGLQKGVFIIQKPKSIGR